jgi:hypothetical protein
VQAIGFLLVASALLGLSRRVLGGSTRMTLLVVVAGALVMLYAVSLR